MTHADGKRTDDQTEIAALFALLRTVPKGTTWTDITTEVRYAESAIHVLEGIQDAQSSILPDPSIQNQIQQARKELTTWEKDGLNLVTILSSQYPANLADVFDCPPFLFYRGTLIPTDCGMSIVGARNASPAGEAIARDVASILVDRGLTVISGLAEGIDTAAHKEALRLGGRTVAIIGTGIRKSFPASNRLLQEEIGHRGLIISQFYPDQPPSKHTFPIRNGTMSGYGLATIVIEAGEHSGSRIQARKAADHGRPVILSSQVVHSTTWGAQMAQNPWVYVATSRSDVEQAVDQIISNSNDDLRTQLGLALA